MGSTFFGFNIATSGLFASQRALNVTSNNIANANTEGYTRERLNLKASRPDQLPSSQGEIGTGVDSLPIIQIRDEFLDFKIRGENSTSGEWSKKEDVLTNIEAVLNEPSNSGITTVMNDFYSALQELSKNPSSLTTRALVRQRSIELSTNLSYMSTSLQKMQSDLDFELTTVTDQINGYASQIAELNKTIYTSELDGSMANTARDQRNLLLDKMSKLVDINYYEDSMNRFYVNVNGHNIVSHYSSDELILTPRTTELNETDPPNLNEVSWKSGATFTGNSGTLSAIISMRDNGSGSEKGIPYYIDKLNEFTDTLVSELNRIQMNGYDLTGTKGVELFTMNGMSASDFESQMKTAGLNNGPAVDVTSLVTNGVLTSNTTDANNKIIYDNISNILSNNAAYTGKSIKLLSDGKWYVTDRIKANTVSVSSNVDKDLNVIAASATQKGIPGDGTNAIAMAGLRSNVHLFAWGSPDDFVKSLISNLGVDTSEAKRINSNQETLINQIETKRQSIAGVSLDEEMSEMMKFQHSYNASARMVTTIDEMLDVIVNKLGTVGR